MTNLRTIPRSWSETSKAMFNAFKYPTRLIYTGLTTNNTQTEVFINGIANRRLVLPNSPGVLYLEGKTLAYNVTDGNAASIYFHQLACEVLSNDTFQLANGVDLDGAGSQNNNVTIEYGATANDAALDLQGTAAGQDHVVRLRVTGQTSKTIRWVTVFEFVVWMGAQTDYSIQSLW